MPSKTKIVFGCACLLLLGWILATQDTEMFLPAQAFAAAGATPTSAFLNGMITFVSFLITIFEFFSFIFFFLIQFLLDPEFILGIVDGQNSGGGNVLLKVWQVSRDIMNIIFAFMLIIGALVTVVMHTDKYVKEYFMKFIIAVVLVNFSWFFPRVILDVANVLTATVYSLPSLVEMDCTWKDSSGEKQDCRIFTDFKFFDECKKENNVSTKTDLIPDGDKYYKKANGTVCFKVVKLDQDANTSMGILNGLVVNHGRMGDLSHVKASLTTQQQQGKPLDKIQDLISFLIHTVFVIALHAMMFFVLAAMFLVFLVRIPIIWLTIAFMPFMFISYVAGPLGPFNTMDIFSKFTKAAILPAVTAVPLAAGFIMLNALNSISAPPGAAELNVLQSGLLPGVDSFWEFLWLMTAYLVIWIGFFAALKIDDIYAQVGGHVKAVGGGLGMGALKAPLNVPIPVAMGSALDNLGTRDGNVSINEMLDATKSAGRSGFGAGTTANNREVNDTVARLDNTGGATHDPQLLIELKKLNQGLRDGGSRDDYITQAQIEINADGASLDRRQVLEVLSQMGLDK